MEKMNASGCNNTQIGDIAITQDTLIGRGGLSLFVRYLRGIGMELHMERLFGSLRGSREGLAVFESVTEDVGQPAVPMTAYPTTVRRVLIDFAAKIVSHSGKIILKVTHATWDALRFRELWICSGAPPVFTWT